MNVQSPLQPRQQFATFVHLVADPSEATMTFGQS